MNIVFNACTLHETHIHFSSDLWTPDPMGHLLYRAFNYNQLQVYAKLRQGIYASWAANAVSEIHCLLSAFSLLFIFLQLF